MTLDVMPVDEATAAPDTGRLEHRESLHLFEEVEINTVTAPYFLIAKLEAYRGRGNGDNQEGHDIEDIVAVLNGRPGIVDEIRAADTELKAELSRRFARLVEDQVFLDIVTGHMRPDRTSQARVPNFIATARRIAAIVHYSNMSIMR